MKNNKIYLYSFLFIVFMVMTMVLISVKQKNIYNSNPVDIERLISIHPDDWYEIESSVTSPAWLADAKAEYDKVSARTYRNSNGGEVTVVMTWSRNGIQRAGHVQQLCYSAQGFSITEQKNIEIQLRNKKIIVTNFVATQKDGQIEDVFYWRITEGKLMNNIQITSLDDQRLSHRILKMKEVIKHILYKIPDNVMVRVSARRSNFGSKDMLPVLYIKQYLDKLSSGDLEVLTGV